MLEIVNSPSIFMVGVFMDITHESDQGRKSSSPKKYVGIKDVFLLWNKGAFSSFEAFAQLDLSRTTHMPRLRAVGYNGFESGCLNSRRTTWSRTCPFAPTVFSCFPCVDRIIDNFPLRPNENYPIP